MFLYLGHLQYYSYEFEITFAKRRWVVPLRGMSGNAADNDLTDKFIAFITEESQSFSCLVTVLVQGLVTIIGNTGVWARVVFYWQDKEVFQKPKTTTTTKKPRIKSSRNVQKYDLQTHFGLRSLHLGVPVSLPWQEIWLGPSS